jgi:alginate O-acetyltransferase complex protein AlgI
MLFSSFAYVFGFLPVVVLGFWAVARLGHGPARWFLIVSSLTFYALGDARAIPALLLAAVANCWLGQRIGAASEPLKSRLLRLALVLNLGQLLLVKYWGFLLGVVGLTPPALHWHVPLGISFFTLIQMVYLVDCYEGLAVPHSFGHHLLFSSFFPYVTMGPFVRSRDVPRVLPKPEGVTADDVARAIELFVLGLFKKTVFAQSLTAIADTGWGMTRRLSLPEAWLTVVAFALELYFDFSGYSDMALGSAALLGVKLPLNFDAPYKATSIIMFWKRWHITLSSFITTYLYTPLVRLRRRPGFGWAMAVTVLSMVIAGLWHGAAWTFVIFGFAHGVALAINHVWRRAKIPFPAALGWPLTFGFVACTLVFYRAPTLAAAGQMFGNLLGLGGHHFDREAFFDNGLDAARGLAALAATVVCLLAPTSQSVVAQFAPSHRRAALLVVAALTALIFLNSLTAKAFIYRDF